MEEREGGREGGREKEREGGREGGREGEGGRKKGKIEWMRSKTFISHEVYIILQ